METGWREATRGERETGLVVDDKPRWGWSMGYSVTEGPRPCFGTAPLLRPRIPLVLPIGIRFPRSVVMGSVVHPCVFF